MRNNFGNKSLARSMMSGAVLGVGVATMAPSTSGHAQNLPGLAVLRGEKFFNEALRSGKDPNGLAHRWFVSSVGIMRPPASTLQVSPATALVATAVQGGAILSVSSFPYQLAATTGKVQASISGIPGWLSPSFNSATVTTSALTNRFTLTNLGKLARGTYTATIAFTNTSNGEGTTRSATLRIYDKTDCYNGGWKNFIASPSPFGNQNQCVRYFAGLVASR
jgi:hypothetical protein